MKKSIIYTSALSLALVSGVATTALLNNANAETTNPSTLESLTDTTTLGTSLGSKNETVYVITDAAGKPTKAFLGNILETSESKLPVELKITYTLDGKEISAADLTGKSGHVKISYDYSSTQSYQGKQIPFLMLTGIQLDGTKFTNLKIDNGKIISEGNTTMLAGYAIAGLGEDLDTDLVPSSFTIEADVKDFALETTYTLATNDVFADLDTSKLSTVDELIDSMNQLDSGISQILDGATSLDDGLGTLLAGVKDLQSGAETLNSGANQLATGAASLSDGAIGVNEGINTVKTYLDNITANNDAIASGITQAINPDAIIAQVNRAISGYGYSISLDTYEAILPAVISFLPDGSAEKQSLQDAKNALDLYTGIISYLNGVAAIDAKLPELTAGTSALAAGASDLASGADQLLAGTTALKTGVDTLTSGAEQLANGSHTLKDGIATFKRDGIDRLVNFATNDLANFTANLRSSVNAAKSYHSYKSTSADSVKFIFKTPSVK